MKTTMVHISFDSSKNRLNLGETYRDHLEQIIVCAIFLASFLIVNLYYLIATSSIPTSLIIWLVLFFLIELYYILPTARLRLDLVNNTWSAQKLVFAVPFKQVLKKISDISKFIVYDSVNHKPSSSKLTIPRTKYKAAFQIWLFADQAGNQEKISIFSQH